MMAPSRRLIFSVSLLVIAILMLAIASLCSGAVTLDLAQVFNALTGSAPRAVTMVVTEWRLPRVAMAMLVGAALGVDIFQPGEQDALLAFGAHVEGVRQWGRLEREKIGL